MEEFKTISNVYEEYRITELPIFRSLKDPADSGCLPEADLDLIGVS